MPEVSKIVQLAKFFNVTVDELLDQQSEPSEKMPIKKKKVKFKGVLLCIVILIIAMGIGYKYYDDHRIGNNRSEIMRRYIRASKEVHLQNSFDTYEQVSYSLDDYGIVFQLSAEDGSSDWLYFDINKQEVTYAWFEDYKTKNASRKDYTQMALRYIKEIAYNGIVYGEYEDLKRLAIEEIAYQDLNDEYMIISVKKTGEKHPLLAFINREDDTIIKQYRLIDDQIEPIKEGITSMDVDVANAIKKMKKFGRKDYAIVRDQLLVQFIDELYESTSYKENVAPLIYSGENGYTISKSTKADKGVDITIKGQKNAEVVAINRGVVEEVFYDDQLKACMKVRLKGGVRVLYGNLTKDIWLDKDEAIYSIGQLIGYCEGESDSTLYLYVEDENGKEIDNYEELFDVMAIHANTMQVLLNKGKYDYHIDNEKLEQLNEYLHQHEEIFHAYNPGYKPRGEGTNFSWNVFNNVAYDYSISAQATDFPTVLIHQSPNGIFTITQNYSFRRIVSNFLNSGIDAEFVLQASNGYEDKFEEREIGVSIYYGANTSFSGYYDPINKTLIQEETTWEQLKGIDEATYKALVEQVELYYGQLQDLYDEVNEFAIELVDIITDGNEVEIHYQGV